MLLATELPQQRLIPIGLQTGIQLACHRQLVEDGRLCGELRGARYQQEKESTQQVFHRAIALLENAHSIPVRPEAAYQALR
ncbi:hypothetical protein [Aeromonas veronii]|uniref:hypothetical protein n=1 Tax=Aeromonas veronii TaxID=654 RepID=UPI000B257957|nr:hypothetical protein [Aeromonas veronii]